MFVARDGRGLAAADMLLTRLKRQRIAGFAIQIDGFAQLDFGEVNA